MSSIKIISYIMNNKYLFDNPIKLVKNIIYNTKLDKLNELNKDTLFLNNNKDIYNYYKKILKQKQNEEKLKKYDLILRKNL
jgi:hypothetical protein